MLNRLCSLHLSQAHSRESRMHAQWAHTQRRISPQCESLAENQRWLMSGVWLCSSSEVCDCHLGTKESLPKVKRTIKNPQEGRERILDIINHVNLLFSLSRHLLVSPMSLWVSAVVIFTAVEIQLDVQSKLDEVCGQCHRQCGIIMRQPCCHRRLRL